MTMQHLRMPTLFCQVLTASQCISGIITNHAIVLNVEGTSKRGTPVEETIWPMDTLPTPIRFAGTEQEYEQMVMTTDNEPVQGLGLSEIPSTFTSFPIPFEHTQGSSTLEVDPSGTNIYSISPTDLGKPYQSTAILR